MSPRADYMKSPSTCFRDSKTSRLSVRTKQLIVITQSLSSLSPSQYRAMAPSDSLRLPTPPPSYQLPPLPPSYTPFDTHLPSSPRELWRRHCRERMQMLYRFLTVLKRQVREMDTLAASTEFTFQQHRSEAEAMVSLLPAYSEDPEGYAARAALFDEVRSGTAVASALAKETREMQALMGALVQNMLLEDRKMADLIILSDAQCPLSA